MKRACVVFSCLLLSAAGVAAARPGAGSDPESKSTSASARILQAATPAEVPMVPFVVDWSADVTAAPLADVSFLLHAPAGKEGFIGVRNGHLALPDGSRFRIWGINATMQAGLPAKAEAPLVAASLARRGLNCVRFHFLDRLAPTGLIDASRDDTRRLDPQQLDRLDFFIAELQRHGIYANLNLNVGRTYKAGDGVRDFELLGFPKGLTYFNERLIELQQEYARELLTHVNPYTGHAYSAEPAVAIVEFVNENSLVEAWFSNRLLGNQTNKPSGTWNDIPPSYAAELTVQYNTWLAKRLPPEALARLRTEAGVAEDQPVPRLRREEFGQASKARFQAEGAFYVDVERGFFLRLAAFLREELGVKSLLVGNSDHGHSRSGYPIVASTSLLDVVDGHVYWQHPNYLTDPKTGRRAGFEIKNTPMVDDPLHSSVVQLSRSAVAGKPYTVSEVNHPFPNEYAAEGVPVLAAYAALQDWDGVFWYTLAHQSVPGLDDVVAGHFDFAKDPVKLSQVAAGALMFLRGDVQPARQTAARSYTREQVLDSIRLPGSEGPYFTPGFPLSLPLQQAVRVASLDGTASADFGPVAPSPIESDTGELAWHAAGKHTGLVRVNTARSQALIGFCAQAKGGTEHLAFTLENSFAAVTLSSLDVRPIVTAPRLLLTLGARVGNSGMAWNAKRTSLETWGHAPTTIEPVRGTLRIKNLSPARGLTMQPLDGAGRPMGSPITAKKDGDHWIFPLGEPPTTWALLSVER